MARIGDTPRPCVARGLFPTHHPYELTRSFLGRIAAAAVLKAEMGPVEESDTRLSVIAFLSLLLAVANFLKMCAGEVRGVKRPDIQTQWAQQPL